MQTLFDLGQSPIIYITAILLGLVCETLRRLIPVKAGDAGWRGVFYVISTGKTPDSQGILPVLLAAPLGFVPWLPAAECLMKPGYETAAHFGTYVTAGIACTFAYSVIVGTVMNVIRHQTARASLPPSGGGSSGT